MRNRPKWGSQHQRTPCELLWCLYKVDWISFCSCIGHVCKCECSVCVSFYDHFCMLAYIMYTSQSVFLIQSAQRQRFIRWAQDKKLHPYVTSSPESIKPVPPWWEAITTVQACSPDPPTKIENSFRSVTVIIAWKVQHSWCIYVSYLSNRLKSSMDIHFFL